MRWKPIFGFSLIISLFFIACSIGTPEDEIKSHHQKLSEFQKKLRFFAKNNNKGRRNTKDPAVVKDYFQLAYSIVDYAESNSENYMEAVEAIKKKGRGIRHNPTFDINQTAYQYSRRALKDQEEMVLRALKSQDRFEFNLDLQLSKIFKNRPEGHKVGGSKKYDSIRKKFN